MATHSAPLGSAIVWLARFGQANFDRLQTKGRRDKRRRKEKNWTDRERKRRRTTVEIQAREQGQEDGAEREKDAAPVAALFPAVAAVLIRVGCCE
jgi:hypothetical protein